MANVLVSIDLPYLLLLPTGEYPTPGEGGSVRLDEKLARATDGASETVTVASMTFGSGDCVGAETLARARHQQADRLFRRVNRLLRWYRVVTGQTTIIELSRAQASPFGFTLGETGTPWCGAPPLEFESA